MTDDRVEVAVAGHIDRDDRCSACGRPMVYRVRDGRVTESFCSNAECHLFLVDIAE